MTTHLPLLTTHIRSEGDGDQESPLARQWRLLKLLVFAPRGFTVKELVAVSGVSEKTIRRDLVFLKEVGFDLSEKVEEHGRKVWRIRRLSESTDGKGARGEKYCLIRDTLQDLHDIALMLGDSGLAEALKRLGGWVEGKCRNEKPKPR